MIRRCRYSRIPDVRHVYGLSSIQKLQRFQNPSIQERWPWPRCRKARYLDNADVAGFLGSHKPWNAPLAETLRMPQDSGKNRTLGFGA